MKTKKRIMGTITVLIIGMAFFSIQCKKEIEIPTKKKRHVLISI